MHPPIWEDLCIRGETRGWRSLRDWHHCHSEQQRGKPAASLPLLGGQGEAVRPQQGVL